MKKEENKRREKNTKNIEKKMKKTRREVKIKFIGELCFE